ncbi:MAG TPA: hypothetical protein VNO55_19350 [Polyangia bacterium]|nr:hypothetical protein [Polyangia bacterium]
MSWSLRARLFATVYLVFAIHFNSLHDNAQRYVYLVEALAEQHTVFLDHVPETNVYPGDDVVTIHGHRCADNNPGISLLAAPFWMPFARLLASPRAPALLNDANVHFFLAHLVSTLVTTIPAGAFAAVLLAELVFDATRRRRRAVFAAMLFAFGTNVFHHATQLNQNIPITAIVLAVFVLLTKPHLLGVERPVVRSMLVGFLIGLAVFIDLSIAPFCFAAIPWMLRANKRLPTLAATAAGAAVPLLALAIFQQQAYGNPFRDVHWYYYSQGARRGMAALIDIDLRTFMDQLVLPGHGLFLFFPFTALGAWYLAVRKRNTGLDADGRWFALAITVAYLLYALLNYGTRNTYFGPRYLIPVVPFLVWAFCVEVADLRAPLAVALTGISFFVGVSGAQFGFGTGNIFAHLALYFLRAPWIPFLTWARLPQLRAAGLNLPELTTPWGPLIFLGAALTILWLPVIRRRDPSGIATPPVP